MTAAEATLRSLEDGVRQIARLSPGDVEVGPFNALRKSVIHASSGREATPEALLGELEPKDPVLRYLVDLHEAKKMYRKQIVAVAAVLLQVPSWARALHSDEQLCNRLPEDLRALIEEQGGVATDAVSPPPAGEPPPSADAVGAGTDGLPAVKEVEAQSPAPAQQQKQEFRPPPRPVPQSAAGASASGPAVEAARKQLQESMELIARLPSGSCEASAFVGFRRGVVHATSSSCGASPAAVLGDLEPKTVALQYLLELHQQKKMYQKQIADVVGTLLLVREWVHVFRDNAELRAKLPEDLRLAVEETIAVDAKAMEAEAASAAKAEAEFKAAAERAAAEVRARPPPAAVPPQDQASSLAESSMERPTTIGVEIAGNVETTAELAPPTGSEVQRAIDSAKAAAAARQPVSAPKAAYDLDGSAAAVKLLQEGKDKIEALGFSAENLDEAVTAFETFGRAVTKVVQSPTTEDDKVLDELEPKAFILEFLLDIYERKSKFRSRVSALLTRLLAFDSWRSVAKSDPSLQAGVRDLVVDLDAPQTAAKQARDPSSDLKRAAMNAASSGATGVVYIRIIAGRNLINTDSTGCSDPYVRVAVEGRTKRTEVINDNLNPCWDAAPFLFEVSAIDKAVRIDVLDRDFMKDDALGHLEFVVAKIPTAVTKPIRHRLNGVAHGELEMEMAFAYAARADGHSSTTNGIPKGKTAPSSASDRWVTWLSVDPRSSRLDPYPADYIRLLEAAWQSGDSSVDLGVAFFGASVQMSPKMLQRTVKGSRDVLRSELSTPNGPVIAHVVKGKDWRLTGDTSAAGVEVRELELSPEQVLKMEPQVLGQGPSPSANPCLEKLEDFIASALQKPACLRAHAANSDITQKWITWLSVEPRTSNLQFYPAEVARKLEAAWLAGQDSVDLGQTFHGAKVQLRPKLMQRTANGSRDICRLQIDAQSGPAMVNVVKGTDWRVAPAKGAPGMEQRTASVPPKVAILL